MHVPAFTLACAGVLGVIFVVLSARVVMGRNTHRALIGDGAAAPLLVLIRSHANFAEYAPLCLLLIGGLEMQGGATVLVKALGVLLVLSRLAHPVGMAVSRPNLLRAGGFGGTLLVLLVASVAAVLQAF